MRPAPGQMPNSEERSEVELIRVNILKEYADMFSDDAGPTMKGPPMGIKVNDGATPCRVNGARAILFVYGDQVKEHLDQMVKERVIEPVSDTCDWCHPIVLADKKNTAEKRLTIDLTKLNSYVQRPTHPMRTQRDTIENLENARFLTTLDARHGYWQVPLAPE